MLNILEQRKNAVLENEHGIKPTHIYTTKNSVSIHNERELDILASQGLEFSEYEAEVYIDPFMHVRQRTFIEEKVKKEFKNAGNAGTKCKNIGLNIIKKKDPVKRNQKKVETKNKTLKEVQMVRVRKNA